MYSLYTMAMYLAALIFIWATKTEVAGKQQDTNISINVNTGVARSSADLPDILLKGMIIVKIKTLSYIPELSYPDNNLTKRLTVLCEREMAKMFHAVKGKQTVKVESFRRGRWSAVVLVMIFDSAGNGNASEISEIIKKKINDPGKFINYNVDRRMASFRPEGVFCQPRVHYAFESSSERDVYDDSGFDNNGVIYGTLEITRHGKCGKAAKFKNGYIYLRKFRKTKTSGTDAILVTFWMRMVKPRSSTSLFRGYYKGAVVELFMNGGILTWKYITRQEAIAFLVRHTKLLKARQWTHIVALYDPYMRKAKLYVDSELSHEVDVRKGMVHWRFTSSLRVGMTSTEGYLDDLYVYDCILSEKVLNGIRKDCWCQELCAPRGKNEFLIRMILLSTNSSRIATEQLANKVQNAIKKMFEEISGQQRVQTIGHRPLDVDSLMVDYSLQSIGNSDTRYLAGVMQPAITAGKIAGVQLTSNEVSFIPISGKSVCLSNEMKCGDGECINKLWKCDGEINCADGSDEIDCGRIIAFDCQSNEFTCNRSRVFGISDCIDARYRCDGQLDCDDDSDERGCVPPKLISTPRSLLILAEGETASCTCVASGVPHPKVSWYYRGVEVSSIKGKVSVTSVSGLGTLTIYNVGQEDSGDYICKISDNLVKKTIAPSCTIKVRAFGNVCRPPFFNSEAQRSDECLRCFCHERTTNCRSAQLYTSKLTSRWDCESCAKDKPTLVNKQGKPVSVFQISTTTPLYWQLPTKYSGNKLTSYGGNLKFVFDSDHLQNGLVRPRRDIEQKTKHKPTVWNYVREVPNNKSWFGKFHTSRTVNDVPSARQNYRESNNGTVSGPRILNLTGGHSVFIVGDDGTHLGSTNLDYLDDAVFGIRVTEENWKEPQRTRTTSRPTLLRVLSDIKYIFIKASSSGDTVSGLLSVILDTAVKERRSEKISVVEQCSCPVGYSGLSCETCAGGYFRPHGTQTCVKCSCYNHSGTCHPVTGKCENCAHNTEGVNCEVCKPGYYGNATKGTSRDCKKCNCPLAVETNTFSDLCYLDTDGKSTCSQCQTGYAGRNCEFCAQGYQGNPTILGRNCYKVGNFSQCNLAGSVSEGITTVGEIQCACKSNVLGSLCDTCRQGTFNLQVSNPSGCEKCFCSGKSKNCTNFVGSTFTIQASFLKDDFKLATVYSRHTLPHLLRESKNEIYLQRTFSGRKIKSGLYWHLPVKFSGSKVASYGGYLEYTVTYAWNATRKPSLAYDVILLGKKFGIKYVGRQLKGIEYQNGSRQTYRAPLLEKFWRFSSNSRVSKIIFVLFLGRIDRFLILASPFVDMIETRLHDVKLDGAVENKTGVYLPRIERCSCPPAYTGYSCESCAVGYTASGSSIVGRCVKCNCHGHSSYCHPQTGLCQDCQHNTTGKYCEKCKPGFYGKPKTGSHCRPCPCPRVLSTNSREVEATCHMDKEGEPVCDRCPEGHEGKICDRCKESFTGNPKVPGEFCKPISSCGCNHVGTQTCDEKTKRCICKKNVEGEKCDKCKSGFYNLRERNEDGCTSCFCMGFSRTCTASEHSPKLIKFSPQSSSLPRSLVITTEDLSRNTSDFEVDMRIKRVRFLDGVWLGQRNIYWMIPQRFLGNKLLYYGGTLSFYYSFQSLVDRARNDSIKIKGNGQTLFYKDYKYIPSKTEKNIKILLLEDHWYKTDGSVVSRDEFMRILAHIDFILIPTSYSRQATESRLGDVALVGASEKKSTVKAEICDCPPNATGSSCESCAAGFTKNGKQISPCVPCECHSHSTQCDPRTGVCKDCQDNTDGKHCEVCARGFYGNARKGRSDDCKQCPCPLPGSSNRFSETCFLDKDGLPTCDACFEGYTGRRCERCSLNYTGNPSTPGGKCFKVPVELIPTLKIIPESLTVQEGDSAQFVCNVQSPRRTEIVWSKLDGQALSKRATVEGKVLKFKSLKKQDGGTYVCTASNDIVLRTAKSLLVVKKQQLSAVIVDVSPKSRYIPVGGTAKFSCTSKTSSRYSITWSRESNKPLPSGSHVEDGTLIISDAKLSDGGTYICTGKNVLNVDRAIISLHVGVVVKPQVSVTPKKQVVDVADTVKFRCSASAGFPAATLLWKRDDGRQLPQFSKFFSRTGIFKIIAASRRDEGKYMCAARNRGGESVMRVELLVKGPNSVPKAYIRASRVTVDEGETAFLHCDVTGDNPMDISWRKYGATLPRTAVMNGNYLEIKKTTIRDRGRYVCKAKNRYGEASATGSLFINKDKSMSPVVTIKPSGKVISVMEGKTLRLICEVAGNDKASVTWTRQSKRGVLSQNFVLNLVKIKIEDTGVYECTVTTDKGEGKASVSVVVQRNDILPRVQAYPTHVTTRIGKSVKFQCKVSSKLPVTVTWSRADGSSLNKNYLIKNTVLEILSVRKKDEGTFICVAENIFGASKATVELSVFKR